MPSKSVLTPSILRDSMLHTQSSSHRLNGNTATGTVDRDLIEEVRKLSPNVEPASSSSGRIESLRQARKERETAALVRFLQKTRAIMADIEAEVLQASNAVRDRLADHMQECAKILDHMDESYLRSRVTATDIESAWTQLEEESKKRLQWIDDYLQRMRHLERRRKDQVEEEAKLLVVDTLAMNAKLPSEVVQMLEEWVKTVNTGIAANLGMYEVLSEHLKSEEKRRHDALRPLWEEKLQTWRRLRHDITLTQFRDSMQATTHQYPPERDRLFAEMREAQREVQRRICDQLFALYKLAPPQLDANTAKDFSDALIQAGSACTKVNSHYVELLREQEKALKAADQAAVHKLQSDLQSIRSVDSPTIERLVAEEAIPLISKRAQEASVLLDHVQVILLVQNRICRLAAEDFANHVGDIGRMWSEEDQQMAFVLRRSAVRVEKDPLEKLHANCAVLERDLEAELTAMRSEKDDVRLRGRRDRALELLANIENEYRQFCEAVKAAAVEYEREVAAQLARYEERVCKMFGLQKMEPQPVPNAVIATAPAAPATVQSTTSTEPMATSTPAVPPRPPSVASTSGDTTRLATAEATPPSIVVTKEERPSSSRKGARPPPANPANPVNPAQATLRRKSIAPGAAGRRMSTAVANREALLASKAAGDSKEAPSRHTEPQNASVPPNSDAETKKEEVLLEDIHVITTKMGTRYRVLELPAKSDVVEAVDATALLSLLSTSPETRATNKDPTPNDTTNNNATAKAKPTAAGTGKKPPTNTAAPTNAPAIPANTSTQTRPPSRRRNTRTMATMATTASSASLSSAAQPTNSSMNSPTAPSAAPVAISLGLLEEVLLKLPPANLPKKLVAPSDPRTGQAYVELVGLPDSLLSEMRRTLRRAVLEHMESRTAALKSSAAEYRQKMHDNATKELETRLRDHAPRAGRIECDIYHTRAGELIASRQRFDRFVQNTAQRVSSRVSAITATISAYDTILKEYTEQQNRRQAALGNATTSTALQFIFQESTAAAEALPARVAAHSRAVRSEISGFLSWFQSTNKQFLAGLDSASFATLTPEERAEFATRLGVFEKDIVDKINTAIAPRISEAEESVNAAAKEVFTSFKTAFEVHREDLEFIEAVQAKTTAMQSKLRNEFARSDTACEKLGTLIAQLSQLCTTSETEYRAAQQLSSADSQSNANNNELNYTANDTRGPLLCEAIIQLLEKLRGAVQQRAVYLDCLQAAHTTHASKSSGGDNSSATTGDPETPSNEITKRKTASRKQRTATAPQASSKSEQSTQPATGAPSGTPPKKTRQDVPPATGEGQKSRRASRKETEKKPGTEASGEPSKSATNSAAPHTLQGCVYTLLQSTKRDILALAQAFYARRANAAAITRPNHISPTHAKFTAGLEHQWTAMLEQMEAHRTAAISELRKQLDKINGILLSLPDAVYASIYTYYRSKADSACSLLEDALNREIANWNTQRTQRKAILTPALGRPEHREKLEQWKAKEEANAKSQIEQIKQRMAAQRDVENEDARSFVKQVASATATLLELCDGMLFVEDLVPDHTSEKPKSAQQQSIEQPKRGGMQDTNSENIRKPLRKTWEGVNAMSEDVGVALPEVSSNDTAVHRAVIVSRNRCYAQYQASNASTLEKLANREATRVAAEQLELRKCCKLVENLQQLYQM